MGLTIRASGCLLLLFAKIRFWSKNAYQRLKGRILKGTLKPTYLQILTVPKKVTLNAWCRGIFLNLEANVNLAQFKKAMN
jgi:hypothetical protein